MKLHPLGTDETFKSEWLQTLPRRYFADFGDYLKDVFLPIAEKSRLDFSLEKYRAELDRQLFVRMQQANNMFLPWASEKGGFEGKRVLEIGCGTGSCTVPLSIAAGSVKAIDIQEHGIAAARARCGLLGVTNASFELARPDWLSGGEAAAWPTGIDVAEFDVVVCYALLEHRTIGERLNLLSSIWRNKHEGCTLIIWETPNRFAPFDWHSSEMNFAHILPDSLAAHYYRTSPKRSRNWNLVKDTYTELKPAEVVGLYRWGRGVSFHEFDLAIGLQKFRVLNDGYSKLLAKHRETARGYDRAYNSAYERALISVFESFEPKVPAGFARASLDLVIASAAE